MAPFQEDLGKAGLSEPRDCCGLQTLLVQVLGFPKFLLWELAGYMLGAMDMERLLYTFNFWISLGRVK